MPGSSASSAAAAASPSRALARHEGEQHRAAGACCKPGDDADDRMLIRRRRPASETARSLRSATARTTASRSRCASRDGCPCGGGHQEGDPGRPPPAPAGAALGCSAATSMSQPAVMAAKAVTVSEQEPRRPERGGAATAAAAPLRRPTRPAVASSRQPRSAVRGKDTQHPRSATRRARPGPAAGRDKPEPRPLWIARGQPCEYPGQ